MGTSFSPLSEISLKCKNLKCFRDSEQGFDSIKPLNIIIGRNNCGKSTLLDLLASTTSKSNDNNLVEESRLTEFFVRWNLNKQTTDLVHNGRSMELRSGFGITQFDPQCWFEEKLWGREILWKIDKSRKLVFGHLSNCAQSKERDRIILEWFISNLKEKVKNPFRDYLFKRLYADRDVVAESPNHDLKVMSDGTGLTGVIERYINSHSLDRDVVEVTLLQELNRILVPDAEISRILVEEVSDGLWEILLEEPGKGRIPLSQTGSGLKTILLVLAYLLILPRIGKSEGDLANIIFGFEELENNLHPAIQRRLFRYLYDTAIEKKCHMFITTHSSVVIDMFTGDENVQIVHVTHDGKEARVNSVKSSSEGMQVLEDLDVRASDLLQTNAVIWVEGPSDRIYFRKWIELFSNEKLVEGVHYQCVPFGGNQNAHFSFDDPALVNELIAALKINRNVILLVDSDRRKASAPLKEHTQRLVDEVGNSGGYAWVTAGKEVENYLPRSVIRSILQNESVSCPNKFGDVPGFFKKQKAKNKPHKKVEIAQRAVKELTFDLLKDHLDWSKHLEEVCKRLRKWNRLAEN